MKILKIIFVFVLLIGATSSVFAQHPIRSKVWRVSEAYAVLVKERASAKGDLYEAEQSFMPQAPQVKLVALRLALLNREIKKLSQTNVRNADQFSAAYGNLILAKIQTETELFDLRERFTPEFIAVKKKEVELGSLNSDLRQINKNFR